MNHLQGDSPNWDTKTRCACGAEFTSRCEFWKHQADAYVELVAEPEPEVRLLRIKVFRYGLHFKPMLYREEYVNSGGLPARVRVGPYDFAGRAEVHNPGGMCISAAFEAGQVVRFDEDDAGEWSWYEAGWYP